MPTAPNIPDLTDSFTDSFANFDPSTINQIPEGFTNESPEPSFSMDDFDTSVPPLPILDVPLTKNNLKWLSINCTHNLLASMGYNLKTRKIIKDTTYQDTLIAYKPVWFDNWKYCVLYQPTQPLWQWPDPSTLYFQYNVCYMKVQKAWKKQIEVFNTTLDPSLYFVPNQEESNVSIGVEISAHVIYGVATFFPISWSNDRVSAMNPAFKKWLKMYCSVDKMRLLGFTNQQINYIRNFPVVGITSKVPFWYKGYGEEKDFEVDAYGPVDSGQPDPLAWLTDPEPEQSEDQEEMQAQQSLKHDLDVRYRDCYGIKGGKIILATDFSIDPVRVHYKILSPSKSFSSTHTDEWGPDFDFTLPKMGMLNYQDYVVIAERVHKKASPARYRKALRHDVITFSDLSYRENSILGRQTPDFGNTYSSSLFVEMAETVFFPKMFTYEEALESVLNMDRLAAAFSSSMAIRIDFPKNRIILCKYNWVIAQLNPKTNAWHMLIDTFNQDLIDNNIPMEVANG